MTESMLSRARTTLRDRTGTPAELVTCDETVTAYVGGTVVGTAQLLPPSGLPMDAGVRAVSLRVDPAWQRRGLGTRLLTAVARLARSVGAAELLLTTRSDSQAVLPMLRAAGMRGRIRMAGAHLTVRVSLRDLTS